MSLFGNVEDAVIDNVADRVVNEFIPDKNGKLFIMIMLFKIFIYR
jgi:hypothetical protein